MNLREYAVFFVLLFLLIVQGKTGLGAYLLERGLHVSPFHTMNVASYESCRVAENLKLGIC